MELWVLNFGCLNELRESTNPMHCLCMCVCLCVSMYVYMCVCVSRCMYMSACEHVCISLCVCVGGVSMFVSLFLLKIKCANFPLDFQKNLR